MTKLIKEPINCRICGQEIEKKWMIAGYADQLEKQGLARLCAVCVSREIHAVPTEPKPSGENQ